MCKYKLVYPRRNKYNTFIYAKTDGSAVTFANDIYTPRGGSAYLYKVALFDSTLKDDNFISKIA